MCCSVLHCTQTVDETGALSVLQCDAACYSALQRPTVCVAVYSNIMQGVCTLQHTATRTATHCNTLQHTATHSNTPQHTRRSSLIYPCRLQMSLPRPLEWGSKRSGIGTSKRSIVFSHACRQGVLHLCRCNQPLSCRVCVHMCVCMFVCVCAVTFDEMDQTLPRELGIQERRGEER